MDQGLKNQIKEAIADKISRLLIESFSGLGGDLKNYQKVVKDGKVKQGRTDEDAVLYKQDFAATIKDDSIIETLADSLQGYSDDGELLSLEGDGGYLDLIEVWEIRQYNGDWQVDNGDNWYDLDNNTVTMSDNISQFLTFTSDSTTIDTESAKEILDTNIYELISQTDTRQEQINAFFGLYSDLKGAYPNFSDVDDDGLKEELTGEANQADLETRISHLPDDEAFITRLQGQENDDNINRSLEWLRDDLSLFLEDVDKVIQPKDERPEYENQSEGYLKIRHLNQGIIIRRQEGDDVGISEEVDTSNLDANHPWFDSEKAIGPSYLIEGFTITMWVKFLDNVNSGTLFNYGNPLRTKDPIGFRLETFVLDQDEFTSDGSTTWEQLVITNESNFPDNAYTPFQNDKNKERFVRLVVYDEHVGLYDSHLFGIGGTRINYVPQFGSTDIADYLKGYEGDLLTHTIIPIDFNEWYFIVATYNPNIDDGTVGLDGSLQNDPDYWRGNRDAAPPYSYTHFSDFGAKCKVEFISKSDLIRARGFKV